MDFVDAVEVVSAVLWKLKAWSNEELYAIRGAINQVEKAIKNVREIKNSPTFEYDVVKELLKRLLDLVYKMEDFPETFVLRRMLARRMGFGRSRTYIFILLQRLNLKVDNDSAMRKSKLEIDAAARCAASESHKIIRELDERRQSNVHEESNVVGLEEHKKKMVTWFITDTDSRQDLRLVLISGQTGSGKTTLAKEIFKSPEIKRHFVSRAWVSASENLVSNFQSILKQIDSDSTVDDMKSTETELGKKLYEILQKKRCLVVVDNVQSPDLFKIIPGRSALSNEGNGSRVLMTTKDKDYLVKRFVDEYPILSYHHYELQRLQDEYAWLLFKNIIHSNDFEELKSKIMAICRGIPSAIVVLARFLSTKKCYKEWLDRIPTEGNEVSRVSTILASMNSDLTFGLRSCLLYFGLFPKDYEIPVRRLLRLWLAERFVIGQWETSGYFGNPLDAEETAVKYLKELVDRGIIEIAERRKDGSPKTCRMPGLLHDICLSKTEDIGFLHILPNPTTQDHQSSDASPKFGFRRVAEHGDIKNYPRKDSHMQQLRSYLSFKPQNRDTPSVEIGNFLSTEVIGRGFGLLRVLDLESVYKPELPNNLGKLYQLRYLGLRWTFLDTLPRSVSQLRYLETLDVKHTNINSLPNSIWKMKYLRHLCLNEIRLDMPEKQSISLTGLHTLWGLFVGEKSPVKNGLDKSINLKKLGLTFDLKSTKELNDWITSLDGLESLRLRSKDKDGQPSNLELKPLSCLENLTNLYLLGKLQEELHDDYFPHSIIVLTLSVSGMEKDPMPILAKLPNLKVLRLLADSFTGKKIECPINGGFKSLIFLKLWMLKELETWTVEKNAMPNLFELEIRCCPKLKELPAPNPRLCWKIVLTNMPKEFVENARKNHYLSNVINQVKLELEHNAPM